MKLKMKELWKENKSEFFRRLLLIFLSLQVISLTFSIAVSSLSFGLSIFCWVMILLTEKRWERTPMDYFFLLFILAEILSTIFSYKPEQSAINMKRLFIFGVFYMTFFAFKDKKEIKTFFTVFLLLTATLSILEIVEKYLLHIDRIGIFQHYMTTGGIKMIICLYALPVLFNRQLSVKERILTGIIAGIIFITLILTMTRSSWLGFGIGAIVLGIVYHKRLLLYLVIFIALFMLFAPQNIKDRALSSFDPSHPSNITRIRMIETGFKIWQDYPIIGIGDIDVKETYLKYTVPIERHEGGHLHNNFMQILVCFGLFGFVIFVLLFISLFIFLVKNFIIVKQDEDLKILALIPIMVFFAFHLNGLFEWNFGDQEIAILLWFSMGFSMVSKKLFLKKM